MYDWNRKGPDGHSRELNIDLALDAIDYTGSVSARLNNEPVLNKTINLINCEHFCVNTIHFDRPILKDYNLIDSFVIYLCTDGEFVINWDNNRETIKKGETVLIPAMLKELAIEPSGETNLLEIYINDKTSN